MKLKIKNKRGQIEIPFTWLFAIIVGIVIVFIAIYSSSRLVDVGQKTTNVQTGKEIQVLLNPLETSFQSAQTTSITIPSETRINNKCEDFENFGRQGIQLDQKNLGKWSNTETSTWTNNRYIFSDNITEGKKFYIFSKQFNFPFKIADLIYLTSANEEYCFKDAPQEIIEEISILKQENLYFENCPQESITVCFESGPCNISVDYSRGYVKKGTDFLYFAGLDDDSTALMYAAIFSDKSIYECQIKRLSVRLKTLSKLYLDKEDYLSEKGCETNLQSDLIDLSQAEIQNSEGFQSLQENVNIMNENNDGRICSLW